MRRLLVVAAVVAAWAASGLVPARAATVMPEPVTAGNGNSGEPLLSADGRLVAFESAASDLVPGDTNGRPDVFVTDRLTGSTQRVSTRPDGSEVVNWASLSAFSGDGNHVFFYVSSPLLPGETRGGTYTRDLSTGTITRLDGSYGSLAVYAASHDGSVVVSGSGCPTVVVVATGAQTALKCGGYVYDRPTISADGSTVVYSSYPSNDVVPGSYRSDAKQVIYAYDRVSGRYSTASAACGSSLSGTSSEPSVSANGQHVAFTSDGTQLPGVGVAAPVGACVGVKGGSQVYVNDRATNQLSLVSSGPGYVPGDTYSWSPSISGDGRYVTFASSSITVDPLNYLFSSAHYYVRDRVLLSTTRIDNFSYVDPLEAIGATVISDDGSTIAFHTYGFVRQVALGSRHQQIFTQQNPSPAAIAGQL